MPPAISGSRGHDATFAVALALRHGFALSKAQAAPIMQEFNARCDPAWSSKELEHKLDNAGKVTRHAKPRGYLRSAPVTILNIDTSEPLPGESQPKTSGSAPAGPNSREIAGASEKSERSEASAPEPLAPAELAEARRIARELARLRGAGAISGPDDPEAVFYATLLRDFGATFTNANDPAGR